MKLLLENLKTGEIIEVNESLTIGRKNADKVIANDNALSRTHCELKQKNNQLYIKDLGARNSVAINAKKITPNKSIQLKLKDKVIIGSSLYIVKEQTPDDESTRVFKLSDLKNDLGEKTVLDFFKDFYTADKVFIVSNLAGSCMLIIVELAEHWYTPIFTLLAQMSQSIFIWNLCLFIYFLIHKKVVVDLIKFKIIEFILFSIGTSFSFIVAALLALTFQDKEVKAIHYTNQNIELCSNISSNKKYRDCYETMVNTKNISNQDQLNSFEKSLQKLHKAKPSVHTKKLISLFQQKKYKSLSKEIKIQQRLRKK